jgi:hypothetical protein
MGIQTFRLLGEVANRRPIGGYVLGFVDGVTVCAPDNPNGWWFWVAGDGIAPHGRRG